MNLPLTLTADEAAQAELMAPPCAFPHLHEDRAKLPKEPTLAELIDRACDTAAALNECLDAEWGRLNERAIEAEQAMRAGLEQAGLTEALRRAAERGML